MEWTIVLDGFVLMMAWAGGLGLVCVLAAVMSFAIRRQLRTAPRAAAGDRGVGDLEPSRMAARTAAPKPVGEGAANLVVRALEQFAGKRAVGACALALVLSSASFTFAQGNGNGVGNSGRLPNGKPFQVLQQAIRNVESALQQQINDLQRQLDSLRTQVDANTAQISLLTQMVGSLDAAVQQLESRMSQTESSLQALGDYIEAVDARLAFQVQLIAALQRESATQAGAIDQLFHLHNQQQGAIAALDSSLGVINFQIALLGQVNSQQSSQINTLAGQLSTLNVQYQMTRSLLASGCPANSSIRQVFPTGPVVCELDDAGTLRTLAAQQFSDTFTVPQAGTISRQVFCPTFPAGYVATGGGATVPPAAAILAISRIGNGWSLTVYNPSLFLVTATVHVTCTRMQ